MTADLSTWLLIAVASAVGAVARYGVDRASAHWVLRRGGDQDLPWGIALVNLSGCLLVGVVAGVVGEKVGSAPEAEWVRVAQVGLLGSYTTFSTWTVDVVRLLRTGRQVAAAANLLGSMLGGGALVLLGLAMGAGLAP